MWFHPSQTLWTQEEREALQKYIASTNQKKRKNWIECAAAVKTKDVRQCFDFYTLQLRQSGVAKPQRHEWTQEDCEKLARFQQSGLSWKQFQQKHFPGLALGQLKNQSHKLKCERQKNECQSNGNEYLGFLELLADIDCDM